MSARSQPTLVKKPPRPAKPKKSPHAAAKCGYAAQLINGPRSKPSNPIEVVMEALEIMEFGGITVAEMLEYMRAGQAAK